MTTLNKLNLNSNIRRCKVQDYVNAVNAIEAFVEVFSKGAILPTAEESKQFIENYTILSKMTPKSAKLLGSIADGKGKLCDAIIKFNTLRYCNQNPKIIKLFNVLDSQYQIKPPIDFGTFAEQAQLHRLKAECKKYLAHLDKNYKPRENDDELFEIEPKITREQKYRLVEGFLLMLNDKTVDIPKRLQNFNESFTRWKPEVSKHRDPLWCRFLSNIMVILSSIALGAGLIYTYSQRGTFNFFSSRGKLFADEIDRTMAQKPSAEPFII